MITESDPGQIQYLLTRTMECLTRIERGLAWAAPLFFLQTLVIILILWRLW